MANIELEFIRWKKKVDEETNIQAGCSIDSLLDQDFWVSFKKGIALKDFVIKMLSELKEQI